MNEKIKDDIIKRLPAEIGRYLMEINLDKAMQYLDEGVKILPDERYCLLSRATARTRALDIFGAAEDIEVLLKLYPHDLTAHALNNDIEYLNLNFEKALMLNDKYLKQRKFPEHFFLGYMKCMDALLNSLAKDRAGHPLRDHYKVIRETAWIKNLKQYSKIESENKKKRKKVAIDSTTELPIPLKQVVPTQQSSNSEVTSEGFGVEEAEEVLKFNNSFTNSKQQNNLKNVIPKLVNFPHQPLQRRTTNLPNYMSEKYLGQLHKDKCFLQTILGRKGFIAPNRTAEDKLKYLVKNVNTYLNRAQGLMRSTRPFYHIKYRERKMMAGAKTIKDSLYIRQKEEAEHYFTKILHRLNAAYHEKDLMRIIVLAANMVDYYHKRFPKSIIRSQHDHIAEALHVLRDGYFNFGFFSEGMTQDEKIMRVKVRLGMTMEKNPSNDSFFNNLREYNSINWAPRIKTIDDHLRNAQFPEEIIYFNYQLAKLYLETDKLELVRHHTKKAIVLARQHKDMKWVVNTQFLLIQLSMKQNNKMDSLKLLEKTLVIAKTLDCTDLIHFLNFGIDLVKRTDFNILASPLSIIRRRKTHILTLLQKDENNKRNAEIMFRKMSTTPTERTLPILPGVKLSSPVTSNSERRSTGVTPRQTRNTLLRRASRISQKSHPKRGSEFYDLVKDYI